MKKIIDILTERSTFTYGDLMNGYRALSQSEKKSISRQKLSFVEWLIDAARSKSNLSVSATQAFENSLKSVIKEKLEIMLTAVGPVKVDESSSRLLRLPDFISVKYLKSLFQSEKVFEIVKITSDDYVRIRSTSSKSSESSHTFSKEDSKILSENMDANNKGNNSLKQLTTTDQCCASDAHKKVHASDQKITDYTKAKQLGFLYRCQPDVIAALHPSVKLKNLHKAYSFWKSYCTHSQCGTFISWALDMAEYMYDKSKNSTTSFSTYATALKRIIVKEAAHYVTNKPRTAEELTTLVSQAKNRFVDVKFVLEAINDNPSILSQDPSLNSTLSSVQFVLSRQRNDPCYSFTDGSCESAVSSQEKTTVEKMCRNFMIESTLPDCSNNCLLQLRGVAIPVFVRDKITPLLTPNVTWEAIINTLKKMASNENLRELSNEFDSFLELLIGFADKFKPTLDLKKYKKHLMNIVVEVVEDLLKASSGENVQVKYLLRSIQFFECDMSVVNDGFLLKSLKTMDKSFLIDGEKVCLRSSKACFSVTYSEDRSFTLEEIIDWAPIKTLLSHSFTFSEFCQALQGFSPSAKSALKKVSTSFYDLLASGAELSNIGFIKDHLRKIISQEINELFNSLSYTSMLVLNILGRLCEDSYCLDAQAIQDAIEFGPLSSKLRIVGSSVILEEPVILEAEINTFAKQITEVLNRNDTGKRRLGKVFYYTKEMPDILKSHVKAHYKSAYHFIIQIVRNFNELNLILKDELFKYLNHLTMFYEDFFREFFRFVPDFMTLDEFEAFLGRFKDSFVVVGHFEVGNIVCGVRKTDSSGEIMFYDEIEKDSYIICKKIYSHESRFLTFERFFDIVWNAELFEAQRNFIFGVHQTCKSFTFYKLHFRRYLMMYPSQFGIGDEIVVEPPNIQPLSRSPIQTVESPREVIYITSGSEEGELLESTTDSRHHSKKRKETKMKSKSKSIEKTWGKSPKKDRKRKRLNSKNISRKKISKSDRKDIKKSKKRSEFSSKVLSKRLSSETLKSPIDHKIAKVEKFNSMTDECLDRKNPLKKNKSSEIKKIEEKRETKKISAKEEVTNKNIEDDFKNIDSFYECIKSIPNNLIQDVAVGRLMSVENRQIKVNELLDVLSSSLMREKKEEMWKIADVVDAFRSKVLSILMQGSQFELIKNDGIEKVGLIMEKPVERNALNQPPPVIFRYINRLTGVSKKNLTEYITKVLNINRNFLKLSILFAMVSKKYGPKKAITETSNEMLYCQAVSCMKSNPTFFINCVQKRCCLSKWVNESERCGGWKHITKSISLDEVDSFMCEYLKKKDNGLDVDELTKVVDNKFHDRLASLSISSLRIVVQGIIAESLHYGYTPIGKVVYQSSDSVCLFEDELPEESEDDLKIDLSDEEIMVLPDSTNSDSQSNKQNESDETVIIEEYEISLCSNTTSSNLDVLKSNDEVISADSTTADITEKSPSSKEIHIIHQTNFSNKRDTNEHVTTSADVADQPITSSKINNEEKTTTEILSSLLKDPRLKGKLFSALTQSRNPEEGSTSGEESKNPNQSDVFPHDANANTSTQTVKRKQHHLDRIKMIKIYACNFFPSYGYSCETQVFIDAVYKQFQSERFAKSVLGCEAYVRDFIATEDNSILSFGNRYGDVGASWTFYRPDHFGVNFCEKVSLPFEELLPEVLNVVYTFVNSQRHKSAKIKSVCDEVAECFAQNLALLDPNEVASVCRNLILISCIRNLRWFFFAKSEQTIHIRPGKPDESSFSCSIGKATSSHSEKTFEMPSSGIAYYTPPNLPISMKANQLSRSNRSKTVQAVQQMADILRKHGPCKKAMLRDLWAQNSDPKLQKVFGTGVSFAISLRKFEACFPCNSQGLVEINEAVFKQFLRENAKLT